MSVGRGKQLVMGSCSRQPKAAVTVEQLYDEIDSDCGRKGKKRNSKDATISTTTSSSISSTLNILGCSARYQQQQQQHESRERVDDYHPVVVAINDDDDDDDADADGGVARSRVRWTGHMLPPPYLHAYDCRNYRPHHRCCY
mmetsp:Transcript_42831/g.68983  ORF Transcript_42831/g.68983 Transcript_42831/m.68983 type:complete len:142 (+) Transcript_42831:87-512(+)